MRGYRTYHREDFPKCFISTFLKVNLQSNVPQYFSFSDSADDNRVQVSEKRCRASTDKHLNASAHPFSNLSLTHSLQSLTYQSDLRNTNVVTELKKKNTSVLLCNISSFIMRYLVVTVRE